MREQLENIGCTGPLSSNGREAIEQLEAQTFDVLLTDVSMPVMDGYALAEELRESDLELPIIEVTANALCEKGEYCIRKWLSKPVFIKGLYLCLKALAGSLPAEDREAAAEVDQMQIPDQMRALLAQLIRQDLNALQRAKQSYDLVTIGPLLHGIRSALAVTRAKSLIVSSKALETAVHDAGQSVMTAAIASFIERVEAALNT